MCREHVLYMFEGISPLMYTRPLFFRRSRPPMYSDTFWDIYLYIHLYVVWITFFTIYVPVYVCASFYVCETCQSNT
jgi:hypothetical protein